jgi:hypothetical protein
MQWPERPKLQAALAVGAAVLLFGGGMYAGSRVAPTRVQTRDVERVVYRDRTVSVAVAAKTETRAETRHTVRTRVTRPDGTREERTETTRGVDVERREATASAQTVERERLVYRDREVKVERARPDWRAGALVGVDPFHPLSGFVYGATVERRVLGPVWLGAWGLSSRAVGLSLSLEF